MAEASSRTRADVRPAAVTLARRWSGYDAAERPDEELLRSLGALRSDGALTQAGALLFTSADRASLEFTAFDVHGGSVTNTPRPNPGTGILEQLAETETVGIDLR